MKIHVKASHSVRKQEGFSALADLLLFLAGGCCAVARVEGSNPGPAADTSFHGAWYYHMVNIYNSEDSKSIEMVKKNKRKFLKSFCKICLLHCVTSGYTRHPSDKK